MKELEKLKDSTEGRFAWGSHAYRPATANTRSSCGVSVVCPRPKEEKNHGVRGRVGFVQYVKEVERVVERHHTPLLSFLKRYYLKPATNDLSFAQADGRPFPMGPPFLHRDGAPPAGGQRRTRYVMARALRGMTNLYVGAMSWLALGSPAWWNAQSSSRAAQASFPPSSLVADAVPDRETVLSAGEAPLGGLVWRKGVSAAGTEAVSTYIGDLRRLAREPSAFLGVSGGRAQVAELLLNSRLDYSKALVDNKALADLLEQDASAALERPGAEVLPFICDRMAVPLRGADVDLLRWIPASWREALERPDEKLVNPSPSGPYPRCYLRASKTEWQR